MLEEVNFMSFDLDYVSQEFHKKTGKTLNNYYLRGLADMYNINTALFYKSR